MPGRRSLCTYCDYDTIALEVALDEANGHCHNLDRTVTRQAQERDNLEAKVRQLQTQLARERTQYSDILHWYQLSEHYKKSLAKEIDGNKSRVDKISRESLAFKEGKQKAEAQSRAFQSSLKQAEEDKLKLRAEIDSVLREKDTLTGSISDLRSEVNSLQKQRTQLESTLDGSESQLQEKLHELKKERAHTAALLVQVSNMERVETQLQDNLLELKKERAHTASLLLQISSMELIEARLTQSISACWLHCFRAWIRRVLSGSKVFSSRVPFSSFGFWIGQVGGIARGVLGRRGTLIDWVNY